MKSKIKRFLSLFAVGMIEQHRRQYSLTYSLSCDTLLR